MNDANLIAVIPARGGSKGVPRKNVIDLCGKPLIAYSIEAALKSGCFSQVLVSTDDQEIADISQQYGASVPFLRPAEIAGDRATLDKAIGHALHCVGLQGIKPDGFAVLYPTNPFRNPRLIKTLLAALKDGYAQVVTGRPIAIEKSRFFSLQEHELTRLALGKKIYSDNGHTPFFRRYGLLSATSLKPGSVGVYLHPISDPFGVIDIDTYEDLHFAAEVINAKLFDFELQ